MICDLRYRLSRRKTTRYARNLGYHGPFRVSDYGNVVAPHIFTSSKRPSPDFNSSVNHLPLHQFNSLITSPKKTRTDDCNRAWKRSTVGVSSCPEILSCLRRTISLGDNFCSDSKRIGRGEVASSFLMFVSFAARDWWGCFFDKVEHVFKTVWNLYVLQSRIIRNRGATNVNSDATTNDVERNRMRHFEKQLFPSSPIDSFTWNARKSYTWNHVVGRTLNALKIRCN